MSSEVHDLPSLSDFNPSSSVRNDTIVKKEPEDLLLDVFNAIKLDETDPNTIDSLLSMKEQLIEKKESLLKSRSDQLNRLNDLRLNLRYLKDNQDDFLMEENIKNLLNKNNAEYYQKLNSQNKNEDAHIMNQLGVYPSANWDDRLRYLKLFTPYTEIDKLSTFNEYFNVKLFRIIQFHLILPIIFTIKFKLFINIQDDSLTKIEFENLDSIMTLSMNAYNVIAKNYIRNKKINLLMYGLNSLSKLVKYRIGAIRSIVKLYEHLLVNRDLIVDEQDVRKMMSMYKSVNRIDLKIDNFKIVLVWNIVLKEVVTAICENEITIYITDLYDEHYEKFGHINDMFQKLCSQYGLLNSLKIIMKNLFNYEIENPI